VTHMGYGQSVSGHHFDAEIQADLAPESG